MSTRTNTVKWFVHFYVSPQLAYFPICNCGQRSPINIQWAGRFDFFFVDFSIQPSHILLSRTRELQKWKKVDRISFHKRKICVWKWNPSAFFLSFSSSWIIGFPHNTITNSLLIKINDGQLHSGHGIANTRQKLKFIHCAHERFSLHIFCSTFADRPNAKNDENVKRVYRFSAHWKYINDWYWPSCVNVARPQMTISQLNNSIKNWHTSLSRHCRLLSLQQNQVRAEWKHQTVTFLKSTKNWVFVDVRGTWRKQSSFFPMTKWNTFIST